MSCRAKKRILYAVLAVVLIAVEVFIALFVRDRFVRPFVGDMLVVLVIYALVRAVLPEKIYLMPLYVFIFAAGVEVLQYFDIVGLLGLQDNVFMSTLIGSTFDPKDIACYAVGCTLAAAWEIFLFVREKGRKGA